jgi:hypothetical protein
MATSAPDESVAGPCRPTRVGSRSTWPRQRLDPAPERTMLLGFDPAQDPEGPIAEFDPDATVCASS